MCGKKSRGTVVKWCSNGKPESIQAKPAGGNQARNQGGSQDVILSIEQEIELARLSVQNIINDLTLETLQQLTIELAVSGEGSLEFVRDLIDTIQRPEEPLQRPNLQIWCKCGICVDTGHPAENKCCDRKVCVTAYRMFGKLCLDRDVLQLNITARCDIRADPMDFSMNSFRKAAYRQFTLWKYGRLGRGNRRILPSCVVKIIREAYPSPDGQYMGFKNN
ncbi:P2X purinoceptor 7-like [Rhopilema esculentum]|uniref:P2X purinoceptor 7-like n=1 Tax=Rhopilema esculentum TaxID=499914 RepID=UPI0031E35862